MAQFSKETVRALSRNVRRLREEAGYSQTELAKRSGITRSTVAALEGLRYEKPSWETVIGLAEGLGVPVGELLAGAVQNGHASEIVQMFLASDFHDVLAPTNQEIRWLSELPEAYWAGVEPDAEMVFDVLRLRRQHMAKKGGA